MYPNIMVLKDYITERYISNLTANTGIDEEQT